MRNTNKINIPLCLAGVLFWLTLISIYLTSNLFAKYTATSTGSDSARVAGFHPTATITPPDQTIEYDSNKAEYKIVYTIGVANPSEVAVKYDVVISFNDNVLKGATFQFDNKPVVNITPSTRVKYDGVGTLSANQTTAQNYTLTFTVTKELIEQLVAAAPDSTLDLTSSFTATVDFTQLD